MTSFCEALPHYVDARNFVDAPHYLLPALILGVALVGIWMGRASRNMTRDGGPGILTYELAEDEREVQRIFTVWGERGQAAARASLRIDNLWVVFYALTLNAAARAVLYATQPETTWLRLLGQGAAWLALLAGLLDWWENRALLTQLDKEPKAPQIRQARLAAQIKFALIGLILVYVLIGFGVRNLT